MLKIKKKEREMDIIFGETNDQIRIDDQQFFHLTENQEEKLVEGTGSITF